MIRSIGRFLRGILVLMGVVAVTILALAFTPVPWNLYGWMGCPDDRLAGEPDAIVLLGGGGIPSESGLMRSYMTAERAREFRNAIVVVAMPDTNEVSTIRMREELVMRGIKPERILWEERGRNTREQAVNVHAMLYVDGEKPSVLVVTSPEHMRRALGAFRKAGFEQVGSAAAMPTAQVVDLTYSADELGGKPVMPAPEIGRSTFLRYNLFTNIGLQFRVAHELLGMAYYRWMGWL